MTAVSITLDDFLGCASDLPSTRHVLERFSEDNAVSVLHLRSHKLPDPRLDPAHALILASHPYPSFH